MIEVDLVLLPGVAVSLHFANSRLLFVSAHLAAHASAVEIRKQNVQKILSEIVVDDFWEASGKLGPKPKNVTDRFDQTFFLGDLKYVQDPSPSSECPVLLTALALKTAFALTSLVFIRIG